MKASARELTLAAVALVIALFGITGMVARSQIEKWSKALGANAELQRLIDEERGLIAQRDAWEGRYEAVASLMPVFSRDREVTTHWLGLMDRLAFKNKLTIRQRMAGEEKTVGDVHELSIECREWLGKEGALAHFLHDLQSEGAMLDMRQISIKPDKKSGQLKGRFTLYCAYMREEPETTPEPDEATEIEPDGRADAESENES